MNLYGQYNVYKNGELISTNPNLITDNGKSILLQYLSQGTGEWASFINIGAFSTAASVSDYKLYYEITRLPILSKTPVDSVTSIITASGTLSSSSISVSSSAGLAPGYSVSGTGISSSATVTIASISGSQVFISHPVVSTFTGSSLTFKSAKSIKFRSRVPDGVECRIYEIGVINNTRLISSDQYDEKIITNFTEDISSIGWSSGSSVTAASSAYLPRLAGEMLRLSPTPSSSVSTTLGEVGTVPTTIGAASSLGGTLSINTIGYSSSYDTGKLLIYASASGASVSVVGQDNSTGTALNTITIIQETAVSASGPYIIDTPIIKNSLYNDNLTKIEIRARSSASVDLYLDSLKFSLTESPSVFEGLISRSVLGTPISKAAEENVEIEYELFLFP